MTKKPITIIQGGGGGGAGNPAGSNTQLQFNDNGVFGGTNIFYDKVNNRVGINEINPTDTLVVKTGIARLLFGGYNGRVISAYDNGSPANIDFIAPQVNFKADILVADNQKITTENGSNQDLKLTTNNPNNKLNTDRHINITNGKTLQINGNNFGVDHLEGAQNDIVNNNLFLGHSGFSGTFYNGFNTVIGIGAFINANTDNSNNAFGKWNTAIGYCSLRKNSTGFSNVGIGINTLLNNQDGKNNMGVGTNALLNTVSGERNMALGTNALMSNINGSNNIALGYDAGRYLPNWANNTNPNQSLFLGTRTRPQSDNQTNQIVIGYNAIGLGSNTVVIGNDNIITTALKGNVGIGTTSPTQKLEVKGNIFANSTGTGFIMSNRGGNTNFGGFQFLTGNVVNWTFGSRNTGNNDLHFFNDMSGRTDVLLKEDGTIELNQREKIGANTANKSVAVNESGTLFTNEGATGTINFTLPTAEAGLKYKFYIQTAQTLTITANAGDTIRNAGTVSNIAGNITANTVGNYVEMTAINATEWIITSITGTWNIN